MPSNTERQIEMDVPITLFSSGRYNADEWIHHLLTKFMMWQLKLSSRLTECLKVNPAAVSIPSCSVNSVQSSKCQQMVALRITVDGTGLLFRITSLPYVSCVRKHECQKVSESSGIQYDFFSPCTDQECVYELFPTDRRLVSMFLLSLPTVHDDKTGVPLCT